MKKLLTTLALVCNLAYSATYGKASYYSQGDFKGNKTANGEYYNHNSMTTAHMSLPFGTKLKVTNLANNKSVIVRVNNRGNFAKYGRVLDLSRGAFAKIASLNSGVIRIKYEIVE